MKNIVGHQPSEDPADEASEVVRARLGGGGPGGGGGGGSRAFEDVLSIDGRLGGGGGGGGGGAGTDGASTAVGVVTDGFCMGPRPYVRLVFDSLRFCSSIF